MYNPCIKAIGPANARIMAIGEAPGEQEELTGIPFVGSSGQEFDRMLEQAGLHRRDIYLTNVLWTRPPSNKMEAFCVKRADCPPGYNLPPLSNGKYLHPDLLPELERLKAEITSVKPNLILALGGTALWALTGFSKITAIRGTIVESPLGKILPTFHPSYVLRDWTSRTIVIADLIKAERESHFPEIRRPKRYVLINPTFAEVQAWEPRLVATPLLSVDTETKRRTITEIGFAISPQEAIVLPFYDVRKRDQRGSYWTRAEEPRVRQIVYRVLVSPVPKVFQNGLYDIQYFVREGYKIKNVAHDTMLAQHALYPGMPKSLGFLGSIHCNDIAWKLLRPKELDDLKRED